MSDQPVDCLLPNAQPDNTNLIEADQWNANWAATAAPIRLRPWRDYVSWRFATLFRQYIRPGDRVLEVGCGGSRLLPYFAKDLGAEVWGFDFAPAGVNSAKAALARAGVEGRIYQGDLFRNAAVPPDFFDVVYSGGFIEHFTDTTDVVRRIVRLAKPGSGLVITEVPNVGGWVGKVQKRIDPEFYAQHVALTPALMDSAHYQAGAQPLRPAEYFGTISFGVVNYNRVLSQLPRPLAIMARRLIEIPQFLLTAPLWAMRGKFETAAISPFLLGVYRRGEN
jgi:2-polyprenyl-3-methyl-5-hydroxy-6-metoxy-1,4-benzoquinol methylase